jgi:hypothetical protein
MAIKTTKHSKDLMSDRVFCTFCGKSQHEVRLLIAGPGVFVCDECVMLCVDICSENNASWKKELIEKYELPERKEINLEELGVKPRFNKLRFERKKNHIFYLCPFSDPYNQIYQDHVKPLVTSRGFTIDRADEIYGTQPIIEDIWESINSAELIIADSSGRNPNVMYEIGMAHTVGKPVVLMSQSVDDIPFDLKHHRCIIYSYTPRGCRDLEQKIDGTLTFLMKSVSG